MSRFILFLLCVAVGSVAVAAEPDQCRKVSGLAKKVMDARQNGIPMADMMDIAASNTGDFGEFTKKITIAAYEQPRYGTAEMKGRAALDFENDTYLACIKGR